MDPMSGVFDNPKAYEKADTDSGPWVLVTPVSQIAARPVEWLWNGRIPRGMLSMVEGNPDVGKSTVLLDIAARVTRGWKMPDKSGGGDPRAVVLLSAEDDPAKVIRPRLEAGGADLERVVLISIQGKGDGREPVISDADSMALPANGGSLKAKWDLVFIIPTGERLGPYLAGSFTIKSIITEREPATP